MGAFLRQIAPEVRGDSEFRPVYGVLATALAVELAMALVKVAAECPAPPQGPRPP